jgi:hypothetical protein
VVDDKMLDRLSKLMALHAQPGSIGEAEASAAAIQRLLTANQLTYLEAQKLLDGNVKSDYITDSLTLDSRAGWKSLLLNGIAQQNFCRTVGTFKRVPPHARNVGGWRVTTRYLLIGTADNIAVLTRLYTYLHDTINRLGTEYTSKLTAEKAEYYRTLGLTYNPKSEGADFRHGAVIGIVTRMTAARRVAVAEVGSSALVLVEDDKLDKAMNDITGGVEYTSSALKISHVTEHFKAGVAAGLGINLDSQLTDAGRFGSIGEHSEGR